MDEVRLNLGSGDTPLAGYDNIDRKTGGEVYPLDCSDGSVQEIRASHILEHFGRGEVKDVINNWVAKLKPGGILKLAVPDFAEIVKCYNSGDGMTAGYVCGGQIDDNDFHKNIFDSKSLTGLMEQAGLVSIGHWDSTVKDCASLPVSLNLQGQKCMQSGEMKVQQISKRVTAIMSAPRIGFTNNLMLAAKVLVPLNVELDIGYGVFWGQILTRMMEEQIAKGVDWLVVLDYDSYYTSEQFLAMLQLMGRYPEVDAIMPVQYKRENNCLLAGVNDRAKANREYSATTDLIEVDTGHFGCTCFRAEAFKRLNKPWFLPVPANDGGWGEGRKDEDIYFWDNWKKSGNSLYLTPRVLIGHMQLMISWPTTLDANAEPHHQYLSSVEKDGIPEWCKVANDDIPGVVKQ